MLSEGGESVCSNNRCCFGMSGTECDLWCELSNEIVLEIECVGLDRGNIGECKSIGERNIIGCMRREGYKLSRVLEISAASKSED